MRALEVSTNDFLDQNGVYASLKRQQDLHKALMNDLNRRPPLQSFDVMTIPGKKLLMENAQRSERKDSLVRAGSINSETCVEDSDADISKVPHLLTLHSNS